ncbi:hypothetical protein NXW46_16100 [Bacteroides fragilis]|nr:hypothetical protein NXW46_16100 [Bacteroides fragilis]
MLKVFHIISHFEVGGAERVAINIAKSKTPDIQYHLVEVVRGNSEFSVSLKKSLKKTISYIIALLSKTEK